MLEVITLSDYASIELVILLESQDEKKSSADRILSNWNTLFYRAYTKFEDQSVNRTLHSPQGRNPS